MVKYSKEQEERNKAFLSSVRKGVSNERIFKKKPKVAMDKVQKDIPVKYSNDVVVRQNALKSSLNTGSKVSQYLSLKAKEVENGFKPDIDPVIMTRTDYDELESQTQIQKVAFDLCLKIAGNSIQANKLFSFVRPYLREFIKISPQLLTYAEKLSRRSAEDINNYFRKILVKDGVYYTPENPEITLTNFINKPKTKEYKYDYFGDKVYTDKAEKPTTFDTITSNRDKAEEARRLEALYKEELAYRQNKLQQNINDGVKGKIPIPEPSIQDIKQQELRDFEERIGSMRQLMKEYNENSTINQDLEERNLKHLEKIKKEYLNDKEAKETYDMMKEDTRANSKDKETRETNNMMKEDTQEKEKRNKIYSEIDEAKKALEEKNRIKLEQLKDGNESKEENTNDIEIPEVEYIMPSNRTEVQELSKARKVKLYLDLQKNDTNNVYTLTQEDLIKISNKKLGDLLKDNLFPYSDKVAKGSETPKPDKKVVVGKGEETPALKTKEVEGTGFMKSNLSILNKFKYR